MQVFACVTWGKPRAEGAGRSGRRDRRDEPRRRWPRRRRANRPLSASFHLDGMPSVTATLRFALPPHPKAPARRCNFQPDDASRTGSSWLGCVGHRQFQHRSRHDESHARERRLAVASRSVNVVARPRRPSAQQRSASGRREPNSCRCSCSRYVNQHVGFPHRGFRGPARSIGAAQARRLYHGETAVIAGSR